MKNLLIPTITTALLLGATTLKAEEPSSSPCIVMYKAMTCSVNDITSRTINKVEGVDYSSGYDTDITSIDVELNSERETVFLNLKPYKYLKTLNIKKNKTKNIYVQTYYTTLKIEDK
ncbi:hypothetical protein [Arcobacter sp. YIC-310]|uniref:hypothetical protein n=1 Tax=Arcobacter sp. YIC-310 TaxID=3376632 RepID=UPI003C1A4DE4